MNKAQKIIWSVYLVGIFLAFLNWVITYTNRSFAYQANEVATGYFWAFLVVGLVLALTLHFLWRTKEQVKKRKKAKWIELGDETRDALEKMGE